MVGRILMMVGALLIFSLGIAFADGTHDFNETKELIDSGVSCSQLTTGQLEEIGDYYMEQMHPGEEHEIMDRMMGGEGSESLERMHINMARRLYCNETTSFGGMMGGGMMGYGMMDGSFMGGSWGIAGLLGLVFWVLLIVLIILAIIWLYKKLAGKEQVGSAMDILKQRYAKGEITKKEFNEMKKEL